MEALVLATRDDPLEELQEGTKCQFNSGATLVVVPPALLPQWKEEIDKTTRPGMLTLNLALT